MGEGLAASVVCMSVTLLECNCLVKIILLSGKDYLGFGNACHVALINVAQKDGRTSRRTFVLEQQPGS